MTQSRLTLVRDGLEKWSISGEAEWQEMTFEVGGKVHMAALWIVGEYAECLLRNGIQSILYGRGDAQEKHEGDENAATINTHFHRLLMKAVGRADYDKDDWLALARTLGKVGVHV